ncbi:hypothetical protein [Derxia lacustris]|uniref:hypothetical protein n=1 Tax=Derxia lacustris TaxID=764842 RepID=UPI000A175A71
MTPRDDAATGPQAAEASATRLARLLLRAAEEDLRLMVMRGVVASVGAVVATLGLIGLLVVVIVLLWDSWIGVTLAVATPLALLAGGIGALMWADRERESLLVGMVDRLRELVAELFTPAALLRRLLARRAPRPAAATAAPVRPAGAAAADDDLNRQLAEAIEAELERRRNAAPATAATPPAPPVPPAAAPAARPDALVETVSLAAEAFGLSRRTRLWLMAGASASRLLIAEQAARNAAAAPAAKAFTPPAPAVAPASAEVAVADLPAAALVAETEALGASVIASGARSVERTAERVADLAGSLRTAAHQRADRAEAEAEAAGLGATVQPELPAAR